MVITLGVFAQTSVKGKVIDASTSEPLIRVTLYDEVSGSGATTNFDGTFTLSINGKCKYTVSYIGYESQTIALSEKSKDLVIKLQEESIGLKDVVVTSSIAIARKTPVAVSTVSVQSIEQKLGTQEFPEILKSTPGIYATKQGGGYGDSKVNLRGFKSENLAVMINGVPVNDMEWSLLV